MSRRRVLQTGKDRDGDITRLCNRGESWSPREKQAAIRDIEAKAHHYYVLVDGSEASVLIVNAGGKKHLRTTADSTTRNNLDDLPDC